MSLSYGFYNSLNHDRKYNAIQMSSIFDGIINDGVFMSIGDHFNVTADGTNMYVTVGTGRAWFNHTWTLNDSLLPVDIPQSEMILNRYDAIVLEVNAEQNVRANSIKVVKGTPSSSPVYPTLTNTQLVHQYPLAYVYVGKAVTSIRQADITNMIGKAEVPYITGILKTVNIEDMVAQWEDQWKKFFEEETADMASTNSSWKKQWSDWFDEYTSSGSEEFVNWMSEQKTLFLAWFEKMKDQLTEDAAGFLLNEINLVKKQIGSSDDDAFSEEVAYALNNFCVYENSLYKFIENKDPGPWNPDVVRRTSVSTELNDILNALGGLKFIKISESEYEKLENKGDNTVYISPKEG